MVQKLRKVQKPPKTASSRAQKEVEKPLRPHSFRRIPLNRLHSATQGLPTETMQNPKFRWETFTAETTETHEPSGESRPTVVPATQSAGYGSLPRTERRHLHKGQNKPRSATLQVKGKAKADTFVYIRLKRSQRCHPIKEKP